MKFTEIEQRVASAQNVYATTAFQFGLMVGAFLSDGGEELKEFTLDGGQGSIIVSMDGFDLAVQFDSTGAVWGFDQHGVEQRTTVRQSLNIREDREI